MKRYNSEDYYSVINKNTGIKITDCAQQEDALLMVSFDPQNRIITTNKFLMGQVVDIIMPKALPTSEIVVNMDGAVGDGSWREDIVDGSNGPGPNKLPQIKLPEGYRGKCKKKRSLFSTRVVNGCFSNSW
jgi:hypothetical protein